MAEGCIKRGQITVVIVVESIGSIRTSSTSNTSAYREVYVEEDDNQTRPWLSLTTLCFLKGFMFHAMQLQQNLQPESSFHIYRFIVQSMVWVIHCTMAIYILVKSGNRGNLKCLKVNNNFALIFYRKMSISFLSDAKLTKVYDWFLGLIIYIKYLRSYSWKTWRGVAMDHRTNRPMDQWTKWSMYQYTNRPM